MKQNRLNQHESPIFSLLANSVTSDVCNRWAVYESEQGFDVYLETETKTKLSKAHAANRSNLNSAILFAIKMNMICSKKRDDLVDNVFEQHRIH